MRQQIEWGDAHIPLLLRHFMSRPHQLRSPGYGNSPTVATTMPKLADTEGLAPSTSGVSGRRSTSGELNVEIGSPLLTRRRGLRRKVTDLGRLYPRRGHFRVTVSLLGSVGRWLG